MEGNNNQETEKKKKNQKARNNEGKSWCERKKLTTQEIQNVKRV